MPPKAAPRYVARIHFSSSLMAQCNAAMWQSLDSVFKNTEQVIEVLVAATHSTSQKELKTVPRAITLEVWLNKGLGHPLLFMLCAHSLQVCTRYAPVARWTRNTVVRAALCRIAEQHIVN